MQVNKYFVILGLGGIIIGGGVVYRTALLPESSRPIETGVIREITMVAKKNEWRFIPETVEVDQGDRIILTLVNEDEYDHGIGVDAFGIAQRMPANSTVKVEFVVTQAGEYPFYCSVPCGEGEVDENGKKVKRTHFDMIGKLQVRSIISETK